jgi:hypothetical protein
MRSIARTKGLGSAAGIAVCLIPVLLLETATDETLSSLGVLRAALYMLTAAVSLSMPHGPLVIQLGVHSSWNYGAVLALAPGSLMIWLIAPMVGYRRRDALMAFVPVLNVYVAAKIGARAAEAADQSISTRRRPSVSSES